MTLSLSIFLLILGLAAAGDVATRRIPNLLCAVLALAAVLIAFPASLDEALWRAASALFLALVAVPLWLHRALGGGDVKLLAASALWIPLPELPVFVIALALAGGVQALFVVAGRALAPVGARSIARVRMPYALSIAAAGALWVLSRGLP
jgi:prepilin peptidase CpaA